MCRPPCLPQATTLPSLEQVADTLDLIANNEPLLEVGRRAIEASLIEWRDDRLATPLRGNGLVIKERDGTPSSVIRFGPETALKIGLRAVAEYVRTHDAFNAEHHKEAT